jgi:hypothetical protein
LAFGLPCIYESLGGALVAIFKNPFTGNLVSNLAIGVGVAILAPIAVPLVARIFKPVAKSTVKGGILVREMATGRRRHEAGEPETTVEPDGEEQHGDSETTLQTMTRIVKPAVKALMKSGITAYEKGKGVLSETGEGLRELVAEAKAEMAQTSAESEEAGQATVAAKEATPSEPQREEQVTVQDDNAVMTKPPLPRKTPSVRRVATAPKKADLSEKPIRKTRPAAPKKKKADE